MTDYKALCAELAESVRYLLDSVADGDSDPVVIAECVQHLAAARTALAQPELEGPPLEPRGCPTPGACSCPSAPTVPPEMVRALELAEAALSDIGDAEREPSDDLAWAEARAAQDLPRIRRALARWGRPAIEPEPVAERLPEPEDCDARGWCWYWHPGEECWEMVPVVTGTWDEWSHWLPHCALPIPTP